MITYLPAFLLNTTASYFLKIRFKVALTQKNIQNLWELQARGWCTHDSADTSPLWLPDAQLVTGGGEDGTVLGVVDLDGTGAQNGDVIVVQWQCQVVGDLTPHWHNGSFTILCIKDILLYCYTVFILLLYKKYLVIYMVKWCYDQIKTHKRLQMKAF